MRFNVRPISYEQYPLIFECLHVLNYRSSLFRNDYDEFRLLVVNVRRFAAAEPRRKKKTVNTPTPKKSASVSKRRRTNGDDTAILYPKNEQTVRICPAKTVFKNIESHRMKMKFLIFRFSEISTSNESVSGSRVRATRALRGPDFSPEPVQNVFV